MILIQKEELKQAKTKNPNIKTMPQQLCLHIIAQLSGFISR